MGFRLDCVKHHLSLNSHVHSLQESALTASTSTLCDAGRRVWSGTIGGGSENLSMKGLETRREEVLSSTSHNKLLGYRERRRLLTWERADVDVIILGGVKSQSRRIDVLLADDGI
jgi:hypothetical protein